MNSSLDFRECLWAAEDPEVQKSCFLARVYEHKPPKRYVFDQVYTILQHGPTSGFVTISMILNGASTADQFFRKTKEKRFTAMGEMFTAANSGHSPNSRVRRDFSESVNCSRVIPNACHIVPYDYDVNLSPCLRKGYKAHWTLVVGYLIDHKDHFYEIVRQEKSHLLGIWLLSELGESKAIMTEFSQPKQYPEADFILPEGGIAGPRGFC
uniref:Actin maturation protease n=1 Tax=Phlebotomus papatasi TaxID=29031 RepID=A0A1B0D5G9_PHLPP